MSGFSSRRKPVSVLPWFSKILKKFMHKRSIKVLDKHNIISESLEGNRR